MSKLVTCSISSTPHLLKSFCEKVVTFDFDVEAMAKVLRIAGYTVEKPPKPDKEIQAKDLRAGMSLHVGNQYFLLDSVNVHAETADMEHGWNFTPTYRVYIKDED